jgi:hypothetical protein
MLGRLSIIGARRKEINGQTVDLGKIGVNLPAVARTDQINPNWHNAAKRHWQLTGNLLPV